MQKFNRIVLYCRSGFEKECAAEITDQAAALSIFGFAKLKPNNGYIEFECHQAGEAEQLISALNFKKLIFARQLFVAGSLLTHLPIDNRIASILETIRGSMPLTGSLRVEVADTNEGKELTHFCKKFTVPLRQALRNNKMLTKSENSLKPVMHLLFIDNQNCFVGYSYPHNNSPFYMGIPRLKFPSSAPSRSTLKLEEAFHLFIPYEEWNERLEGGLNAVDLGAAPGGWSYQLVKHNMMVHAVDNGELADSLMNTGQIKHYRQDGFKFQPKKNNIYWLVCDMVEKPLKVTTLMANWLSQGWCREAIFNLKLPMKSRYDVVKQNIDLLEKTLQANQINAIIHAKHLYHDREEITVHVQRIWG